MRYGEGGPELIDLLFSEKLVGPGWDNESTSVPGQLATSPHAASCRRPRCSSVRSPTWTLIPQRRLGPLPRPTRPTRAGAIPAPARPPIRGNVTRRPITFAVSGGHGWAPSPVPAAKVINVVASDEDPRRVAASYLVPASAGGTQPGPQPRNGALIFWAVQTAPTRRRVVCGVRHVRTDTEAAAYLGSERPLRSLDSRSGVGWPSPCRCAD